MIKQQYSRCLQYFFSILYFLIALNFIVSCSHFSSKQTSKIDVSTKTLKSKIEKTSSDILQIKRERILIAEEKINKCKESYKRSGENDEKQYYIDEMLLHGHDFSQQTEYEIAALYYSAVYELDPDNLFVAEKLAIELIRNGKLEMALEVLEKYLSKTMDERLGLILAGLYSSLEKNDRAIALYEKLEITYKKSEKPCFFKAKHFAMINHYDLAHKTIEKCQKISNKNEDLYLFQGKLYIQEEKENLAVKLFEKAMKINPENAEVVANLGMLMESKNHHKKALKLYENYHKNYGADGLVLPRLINLLMDLKEIERLIPYLEQLISLDSSDINLQVKLGVLYSEAGELKKSRSLFENLLQNYPESDRILYYLGMLCMELNDVDHSMLYFQKIPPESEFYMDSSLQIANLMKLMMSSLLKEGKNPEFKIVYKKLFDHIDNSLPHFFGNPEGSFQLQMYKVDSYEYQKEFHSAAKILSDLKTNELFKEYYTLEYDYYLASLYEQSGNRRDALELMEKIVEKDADNAQALNFIGYSLLERKGEGDIETAWKYLHKAYKISSNDGHILDSVGWYYYLISDYKKAYDFFKRAKKKLEVEPTLIRHLALSLVKLGKLKEAEQILKDAIVIISKNTKNEALTNEKDIAEIQEVLNAIQGLNNEEARMPANQ